MDDIVSRLRENPITPLRALSAMADGAIEIERLRKVLKEIAAMKPSQIAPSTMPGLVHGPALLLSNCQWFARRALRKPRKK